jgi:hypothetical protein
MFTVYVIEDKHNEDWYYNFKIDDYHHDLLPSCFLPTRELAENFIEDNLSEDNVVQEIEVYSIDNGLCMHYCKNILRSV